MVVIEWAEVGRIVEKEWKFADVPKIGAEVVGSYIRTVVKIVVAEVGIPVEVEGVAEELHRSVSAEAESELAVAGAVGGERTLAHRRMYWAAAGIEPEEWVEVRAEAPVAGK